MNPNQLIIESITSSTANVFSTMLGVELALGEV